MLKAQTSAISNVGKQLKQGNIQEYTTNELNDTIHGIKTYLVIWLI